MVSAESIRNTAAAFPGIPRDKTGIRFAPETEELAASVAAIPSGAPSPNAVKPQMMQEALPTLQAMGGGETVFLSVAAGISIRTYEDILGSNSPILRAMPNTPAAIGQGITALIGNAVSTADHIDLAHALLSAIGEVVDLDSENQMDAVTGVSGSGPAYVFYMIDALAKAGEAQGLSLDLAMQLGSALIH